MAVHQYPMLMKWWRGSYNLIYLISLEQSLGMNFISVLLLLFKLRSNANGSPPRLVTVLTSMLQVSNALEQVIFPVVSIDYRLQRLSLLFDLSELPRIMNQGKCFANCYVFWPVAMSFCLSVHLSLFWMKGRIFCRVLHSIESLAKWRIKSVH